MGWYDEVICRGALDETDLTDVSFLVNHMTGMIPMARSRKDNINSTMKLSVDVNGMAIRAGVDVVNNGTAREFCSAVDRGDICGMSFMFGIRKQRWDNLDSEHPTRYIEKISVVMEVSGVTWPAYEETDISLRDKESSDEARQAFENAKKEQSLSRKETICMNRAKALVRMYRKGK